MKYKITSSAFTLLVLLTMLCGCQSETISPEKIKTDLTGKITTITLNDIAYEFEITDVTIVKEQTNEDQMTLECTCEMTNGTYNYQNNFICYYLYDTNAGWTLNKYDAKRDATLSATALSDIVVSDAEDSIYHFFSK